MGAAAVRLRPSQIQAFSSLAYLGTGRIGVALTGSVRLSVKLSILDTRRRRRATALHLLRHRPSWYPSFETATRSSRAKADPLIVVYAGVTKKQLDEVMLTLDKNGDGEIKFDEFAEW